MTHTYKCIATEHYLAPDHEHPALEKAGLKTSGVSETITFSDSPQDAWNGVGGNTNTHGNCDLTPIVGWKHLYKNGALIKEES